MRDRKFWVMVMGTFVVGVFIFSLVSVGLNFTGFVVLGNVGLDFDDGVYNNTFYNGSGVVLVGENLSGSYVSEIFDAGANASWNSLVHNSVMPNLNLLYGVDGGGDVYVSLDSGATWSLKREDYGRTTDTKDMFSDSSYLYILSSSNREIWRSSDAGMSWSVVNNSFADSSLFIGRASSNENLFAVDGSGDVYLSSNHAVVWTKRGDLNGAAGNNPLGLAVDNSYIYAVDGTGSVFKSVDSGVNWVEINNGYGGSAGTDGMVIDSDGNLYILLNTKIYKSTDSGATWNVINDDISPYANTLVVIGIDGLNNLFILDAVGRTFRSIDYGVSWTEKGDMNAGANNDPKGITEFVRATSLSFKVRSCFFPDCSDGVWQIADLDDLNLMSRYFQYKVEFVSPSFFVSPILKNVSIDNNLINVAPTIGIVSPQDGNTYGYDEGIPLEFFVSDNDGNLDSCWYGVDNGVNVSLVGCENGTFDVGGSGSYVLNVYANDSLGLVSSDSVGFIVAVGAPTISLSSPVSGAYLNDGKNVRFSYIPTDIDLGSCELWGDFDGGFKFVQIDISPISGVVNNFYFNLSDGDYLWNVKCNDSVGNFAFNGNKTFHVDSVSPNVSLNQPVGKKTSRVVSSNWIVSDVSLVSCKYNVYRGGSVEVSNSSVNCSNGVVNFSVTVDADFVFNFYVSDSAGNVNFKSSSFSVDTSSVAVSPSSDGSSGGGGGSGYFVDSLARLKVGEVNVIVSRGEEKRLSVEVKNIGTTSANKCSLVGGDFIDSSSIFNIGVGEIVEFNFVLRALKGVEDLELKVKCLDNISGVVPLKVRVLKPSLDVSILGIKFGSGGELKVDYSVESTVDSEGILYFRVFDSGGNIVSEVVDDVELVLGEVYNGSVVMDVGDAKEGMLRLAISDGNINFVEEDFIYGGNVGVTGFAFLDWSGDFSYIGIILIVFLVLAGLLIRRIWKLRKKIKGK